MTTVREMALFLLLSSLFITEVCSAQCLRCNSTGKSLAENKSADFGQSCSENTTQCFSVSAHPENSDIPQNCMKEIIQVPLNTSSKCILQEGDCITMRCCHNLSSVDLVFEWQKDGHILEGKNASELTLKVFTQDNGHYHCVVYSPCGNFTSSLKELSITDRNWLILIICGSSTFVLVLLLGLVMKYKMKRETFQHRNRREQRAQDPHMTRKITARDDA
ncbi:uncharacterized protein LOC130117362 [Lampris incognitus]|uniref:uncharacterized protein LOC130117362 n=1 Tax=Lampris incognitus TaxID=2546036 RepID=UPI0024B49F41|nr:uncharacterized protein LOC130117362 [Lampris incognitus]